MSVSEDGSLCIWDSTNYSEVLRVNFKEPATCVTVSRDGKIFAVGFKNVNKSASFRVYQYKDGKPTKLEQGTVREDNCVSEISDMKFAPSNEGGDKLCVGHTDGKLIIYEYKNGVFQKVW